MTPPRGTYTGERAREPTLVLRLLSRGMEVGAREHGMQIHYDVMGGGGGGG